jgi:hypothetical protein
MRPDPNEHRAELDECASLGLHPRICANDWEDAHHSEFPISDDDRAIGWAIAYFIGCVPR